MLIFESQVPSNFLRNSCSFTGFGISGLSWTRAAHERAAAATSVAIAIIVFMFPPRLRSKTPPGTPRALLGCTIFRAPRFLARRFRDFGLLDFGRWPSDVGPSTPSSLNEKTPALWAGVIVGFGSCLITSSAWTPRLFGFGHRDRLSVFHRIPAGDRAFAALEPAPDL